MLFRSTSQIFDDRFTDRQSQAGALVEVIDLDETFKNTGPVFFRNADSSVSHTDFHFIFFRLIKDCNAPFACEFDRIVDEIGYYL